MRRVILLLLWGILLSACESTPPVTQPIQFSHKAHTAKGVPCAFCHQFVEQATYAGLPKIEQCMMCHQGKLTDSPEEEKVREYSGKGMEIPWRRLYRLATHVYFSHRRHVTLGEIECRVCHGPIGESNAPLARPAIRLTMADCIACHAQNKVNNDCDGCHR